MLIVGQGFLSSMYCLWYNSFLQMYSLLAIVLIIHTKINIKINVGKLWFYSFYPVHLIMLLFLKTSNFL